MQITFRSIVTPVLAIAYKQTWPDTGDGGLRCAVKTSAVPSETHLWFYLINTSHFFAEGSTSTT
jgi:hypothetical protein